MNYGDQTYFQIKCGASFYQLLTFIDNLDKNAQFALEAVNNCIKELDLQASPTLSNGNGSKDRFTIDLEPLGIQIAVTNSCVSLGIVGDEEEVINSDLLVRCAEPIIEQIGSTVWNERFGRLGAEYLWFLPVDDAQVEHLSTIFKDYREIINLESIIGDKPSQFLAGFRFEGENNELIQIRVRVSRIRFKPLRYLSLTVDSQIDHGPGIVMSNHFQKAKKRFCNQLETLKAFMVDSISDEAITAGAEF